MKTIIDSTSGLVVDAQGSGLSIEGREYHEAPFDERWDDLIAVISEGGGAAALTYEAYRDTGFFMDFFRHNQNDNIFMRYQMPHGWDPTTSVRPHMHYIPMASGSGDAKFNYSYSWIGVDSGTLGPGSTWTTGSITVSLSSSMQYMQKIVDFGTVVPPAGAVESFVLVFKVERPGGTDAADTYQTSKDHGTASANIALLFFDLHYQKNKAGTVVPFPEY